MITGADLFCGAGGFTSGLIQAVSGMGKEFDLLAINHWTVAIRTHELNHANVRHLCANLDSIDPRKVVPSGRLDILLASPECTHHSNARGGKPMNDQSRASAWHILRWADSLNIKTLLIENVREFQNWGPLGANGRPLKSKRGSLYKQFLNSLEALGYRVEAKVLNSANYGDATTRQRLFIQAQRGNRKICWPEATHAPKQNGLKAWRPAREVIDWSIKGKSIYVRKQPLSENTIRRILVGLEKYSGLPFVLPQFSNASPKGIDAPIGTITTDGGPALCQPFLVKFFGGHDACSVDEPLPTICANYEHYGLAQPFLVILRNNCDARSIEEPVPALCANGEHVGLAQPFLVQYYGNSEAQSLEIPLPTITTKDHFGLVEPKIGKGDKLAVLDIHFRMLQPHELAAAMSFPDKYYFHGTRQDQVKQIGNAVPVQLAAALCRAAIGGRN